MSDRKKKKLPGKSSKKPSVFIKNPKIKIRAKKQRPREDNYVVVLDKNGNPWTGYPILEFEITNGPPNHLIDVQVARRYSNLLSGGPGLAGAWDKSKAPKDRLWQRAFSSWSSGEKSLRLDGAGKATYKMPLEWWKDLARIPWRKFVKTTMYYRVLAFTDSAAKPIIYSTEEGQHNSAPYIEVHNNLTSFKVVDEGYNDSNATKKVRMEFTVREANTTEMYTIVQWMQGSFRLWGGAKTYPNHTLYNFTHEANFPDRTIDRLRTDPRYWDGVYNLSVDGKTASATDEPGGSISPGYTHMYATIDFETRIHLNFEIPTAVTITKKDGSPPVYGVITGIIAPPEPLILDSVSWNIRILQAKDASGSITVTHPNAFSGP